MNSTLVDFLRKLIIGKTILIVRRHTFAWGEEVLLELRRKGGKGTGGGGILGITSVFVGWARFSFDPLLISD